jgi:hypothetical protein
MPVFVDYAAELESVLAVVNGFAASETRLCGAITPSLLAPHTVRTLAIAERRVGTVPCECSDRLLPPTARGGSSQTR